MKATQLLHSAFLLTFLLSTYSCQLFGQDASIVKSFECNKAGTLTVKTSGGSITVDGHSESFAEVKVIIKKQGELITAKDSRMADVRAQYDITVEKNGGQVMAIAKRKGKNNSWENGYSISFKVRVPKEMTCNLSTSGGSIQANNLHGDQLLKTSGGSIQCAQINGILDASTSGGSIKVIDSDGDLTLRTSGGSIKALTSRGSIVAYTSGGSITLEDVNGPVDAKTSGGNIKISGDSDYIAAATSGGGVTVNATGLKRGLNLRTSGGNVTATLDHHKGYDLDLSGGKVNMSLDNFTGDHKKNYVRGSMNGGGMPVVMKSSGGSVNVSFN